jgi:hypothetical protein
MSLISKNLFQFRGLEPKNSGEQTKPEPTRPETCRYQTQNRPIAILKHGMKVILQK